MLLPTRIVGNAGGPNKSTQGALHVHDPDIEHLITNEFFVNTTAITTTLAIAATKGDTVIHVVDATGFTVADLITVENGTEEATFPTITIIAVNAITLDQPLDNDYDIGDDVTKLINNMNVLGTLAAPISFKVEPERAETWHIIRILVDLVHTQAADDSKFGSIASLTNGVVLRYCNTIIRTLTNWKTNADMKQDMFDVAYTDKAGGGAFGTNGRFSLKSGTGAVPELSEGIHLEVLIQDDLTALTSFNIKSQGHVVTEP